MNNNNNFVLNEWYMAAWTHEISDKPISRRLLNIPIVLYRTESGKLGALVDRCPHRFAPLSMGKVKGEILQCGYHGLGFDHDGQCADSPFGLAVPPKMTIRSFPVVEKDGCIWFWPGDVERADPSKIPDFGYHLDPAYRVVKGASHIKANFELVADNLMDLTHSRFLHPAFGGDTWVPEVRFEQEGEVVYSIYDLPCYPPNEFSECFMPSEGRWLLEKDVMRWNAPSAMYLSIEMRFADAPEERMVHQPSTHILTPETESTSHYFWASAGPADAPVSDEVHYEAVKWAFDQEDGPMLEAVERNMEGQDFWELQPAILAYDNGGIRARRILRQKWRAEHNVFATDEASVA